MALTKLALIGALNVGMSTLAFGQQYCDGSWSTPFAVHTVDGRPVYVERGVIASDGERTLVLGKPTIVWMSRDSLSLTRGANAERDAQSVIQHAGVFVDATGVATPVPPFGDARVLDHPRLLAATKGRTTIVWEVADSEPRSASPQTETVALTAATLTDGRWVDSQALIAPGKFLFTYPPAVRAVDHIDHRVLAVAVRDSMRQVGLAWATGASWKRTEWRHADYVTYATASRTKTGDIVMVFMGSVANRPGVYGIRGVPTADSVAWTPPVHLDSLSGWSDALSWASLGSDSLLAVWTQSRHGESEMITALTVDGGIHWSLTQPLASSLWMDSQVLAVDAAGVVHMIYRGAPYENVLNEPGSIMHSVWRSGAWSTPQAVSQHPSDTGPMIGSAAGGGLMAVWTEAAGKLPALMPKSVASLWTPNCTSR